MDPARAQAMHAVLGVEGEPPKPGDPLRPFWHQAFFWDPAPAADLGPDGHPAVGRFIPDLGLPSRMWAGGKVTFLNPLRTGIAANRTTIVEAIEHKRGRTGVLAFVKLRHEVTQAGRLVLTEQQDLVYRPASARGARSPQPAPSDEDDAVPARFSETMLFRYSALTFNAHRIHYDADFCRNTLGLAGIVVHGPLLAQMLMLLADERLGALRRFEFRATAPLFASEAAELCWRTDGSMWVRGADGRLIMQAHAD